MSTTLLSPIATAPQQGVIAPALLDALYDALVSERKLLDDLIAQMRHQRSAVGSDDIDGVDDSTFATHRILATLGQARTRRRQLNVLISGNQDTTLRQVEDMLGKSMDGRLRDARQRLQHSADILAREVGMNRKLLREAITSNDSHVRTLVGEPQHGTTYLNDAGGRMAPTPARGVLVNRTA
ncbi:MAG: flagellar export chaperone FlgN [Gemmatimonadaceae bacterium]